MIDPQYNYNYGVETRTITPQTTNTSIYYVRIEGGITAGFAGPGEYGEMDYSTNIKPTLYLNNDIYINSGDGSLENPYTIKKIDNNTTDDNEINSEDTNASNTSITNNQTIDNPETVDNGIKYVKIMIFVSVILIIIINIKLKKKMI